MVSPVSQNSVPVTSRVPVTTPVSVENSVPVTIPVPVPTSFVRKLVNVLSVIGGVVVFAALVVGVVVLVNVVTGHAEEITDTASTATSPTFLGYTLGPNTTFHQLFTEAGGFQNTFAAARMTDLFPALALTTTGFDFNNTFTTTFTNSHATTLDSPFTFTHEEFFATTHA